MNNFSLANSVSSIHSLQITLGIPVTVVQNYDIRTHEIKSKPTCSRRYKKDIDGAIWLDEFIDLLLTIFETSITVKSAVCELPKVTKIFENVEHRRKT